MNRVQNISSVSKKIPNHIAFIMDGNRRWAKSQGLPAIEGHRRGVDALKRTVRFCMETGIKHVTMFAFSTENWKRPVSEVSGLMELLKFALKREIAEIHKNNICVRFIGKRQGIQKDILELFEYSEQLTANNDGLNLNLAFNYGARDDIVNAAKTIAELAKNGEILPDNIDEQMFSSYLGTKHSPDPDLLIRTSGEQRLSNYLLWELSYAEMVFIEEYWPEINHDILSRAIEMYQYRERRFGNISACA